MPTVWLLAVNLWLSLVLALSLCVQLIAGWLAGSEACNFFGYGRNRYDVAILLRTV